MPKFIFIFIILFFLLRVDLLPQVTLKVNDTTISRGTIVTLPIIGTIEDNFISTLSLTLLFDSRLINIISVSGSDSYSMRCSEPKYWAALDKLDSARFEISCDDCQQVTNDTICVLTVEALAGPDSIAYISPVKVTVNGIVRADTSFYHSIIHITGSQVFPIYPEGIRQNFPNPFNVETEFPFSIQEKTKIKLYIAAYDGSLLLCSYDGNNHYKPSVSEKDGVPIDFTNETLEKGEYVLKLYLDEITFSCGAYFMILQTNKGVYSRGFVYLK